MKKHIFFFVTLFAFALCGVSYAQPNPAIDLGIFKNANDPSKLEVRLRPTQDVLNRAYSGGVFTVRFPSDYNVTLSEVTGSSPYGYTFAGPVGKADGYDYYRYQFSGSVYMVNWNKGQQYPLLTLQINGNPPPDAYFALVTNTPWTRSQNGDYYQEINAMEWQRKFFFLPKRTILFDAKALPERQVQLDWEFESEIPLEYTEIEYSTDGIDFVNIGVVPGQEGGGVDYTFIHEKVLSDFNYYRIRMVDEDGGEEYSPVRLINFSDLDADFYAFPNPTQGPLTLVSRNLDKYGSGLNYQVVDNTGRILTFGPVTNQDIRIDLSDMAPGAYYLKLWSGAEQVAMFQVALVKNQ
jgi:hypothetical protein